MHRYAPHGSGQTHRPLIEMGADVCAYLAHVHRCLQAHEESARAVQYYNECQQLLNERQQLLAAAEKHKSDWSTLKSRYAHKSSTLKEVGGQVGLPSGSSCGVGTCFQHELMPGGECLGCSINLPQQCAAPVRCMLGSSLTCAAILPDRMHI